MFDSLSRYLEQYPEATATLPSGWVCTYGIFEVREMDAADTAAHRLEFA